MVMERMLSRSFLRSTPKFLKVLWTFHLVSIAWILFRAKLWADLSGLFGGFLIPGDWSFWTGEALFPVVLITLCLALHFRDKVSFMVWITRRVPAAYLYAISVVLILMCKVIAVGNSGAFIYFDF
jgi:hypothetical protein